MEVSKTRERIDTIKEQIAEKKEAIRQLNNDVDILEKELSSLMKSLTEVEYYERVEDFLKTAEHFERYTLGRQTPTRDIMTNLRRGHKKQSQNKEIPVDYYILDGRYIVLYPSDHNIPNVRTGGSITATEFKTSYGSLNKQEFSNVTVALQNGQKAKLFVHPFAFRAQTYFDMDYRKEWQNGDLVYEGNNYGDTTTFYIVGVLI